MCDQRKSSCWIRRSPQRTRGIPPLDLSDRPHWMPAGHAPTHIRPHIHTHTHEETSRSTKSLSAGSGLPYQFSTSVGVCDPDHTALSTFSRVSAVCTPICNHEHTHTHPKRKNAPRCEFCARVPLPRLAHGYFGQIESAGWARRARDVRLRVESDPPTHTHACMDIVNPYERLCNPAPSAFLPFVAGGKAGGCTDRHPRAHAHKTPELLSSNRIHFFSNNKRPTRQT